MTSALPCPDVHFPLGFLSRLERVVVACAAARGREDAGARSRTPGGESEFVGYRPYRAGEDLRHLDWSLMARTDRAFVRVMQREAGERWVVVLDASASMGVGPPGKLELAAEVAAGLAAVGRRLRAAVRIEVLGGPARAIESTRNRSMSDVLAFLEAQHAAGRLEADALRSLARSASRASRVFVLSDLFGLAPRDVLDLASGARRVHVVEVLAPVEIDPRLSGWVEWWDPEADRVCLVDVDAAERLRYARGIEARIDAWRAAALARRAAFGCFASDVPFEDVLRRTLEV